MAEIKFYECGSVRLLTDFSGRYLRENYLRINSHVEHWYNKLCQEFGVVSSRKIHTYFMRMKPECTKHYAGICMYHLTYDSGTPAYTIGIELGTFYYFSETIFNQTIPHEVAHAFAREIFGEKSSEDGGHGQEWKEIMDYLGLAPNIYSGLGKHVNLIKSCQEL